MFSFPHTIIISVFLITNSHAHLATQQKPLFQDTNIIKSSSSKWAPPSPSVRNFWMKEALSALTTLTSSPCPHEPFGTVIVNHTSSDPSDIGDLICIGANDIASGNPTLHGEIAGINNCSAVLTNPTGHWKLTPSELSAAWSDFTLYTTAEPCAMCASAIRWAGFRECVYGTSARTMEKMGWPVIDIEAKEVFERTKRLGTETALLTAGANQTDPYLAWQYQDGEKCPVGCTGDERAGSCRLEEL